MKKKKLLLVMMFMVSFLIPGVANAQTLNGDWDMGAKTITQDTVIDGNNYTIKGSFVVTNGADLTIKNATIDAENQGIIINVNSVDSNIVIDNVTFTNYTKTGIYAEQFTSFEVKNSTFDASGTKDIDGMPCTGDQCDLIKRSAAGIDINLVNGNTNKLDISKIDITNSTFKNVVDTADNSTAGAIKVKIKNKAYVDLSNIKVNISNNKFSNNVRDLVIGTNSTIGDTTQSETGNINFSLYNNDTMKIVDNSKTGTETDRTITLTKTEQKYKYEFNVYTNDTIIKDVADNEVVTIEKGGVKDAIENLKDDSNGLTLVEENGKYSISIAKDKIKDDLTGTIDDLTLNISNSTNDDTLKQYANGKNLFIVSNVEGDLPATEMTVSFLTEFAVGTKSYLYHLNDGKLELVGSSEVDENGNATYTISHYSTYLLSDTDLLNTSQGNNGNADAEEEILPPKTFDNMMFYGFMSVIAIIAGAFVVIKMKKQTSNQ